MQQRKIPYLSIALLALLVLSISVGFVWAVAYLTSESVSNNFTPAVTSIEVKESFDGTTKTNVYLQNTGSTTDPKGPAVYVRVELLAYWYDAENDHVLAKSAWTPSFTLGSDWVQIGKYYYYKKPVEAGQSTSVMIPSVTLSKDASGNRQVLEVVADAIQSNPQSAVTSTWGVSLDTNGYIKAG